MKKTAVKFFVLATALLLLPIALLAHEDPHRTDSFGCLGCHNPHKSLGQAASYSNVCLSCHKPGMLDRARIDRALSAVPAQTPEYTYVRPFSHGDQANPYLNEPSLNSVPNKVQNSHKWTGTSNVPAAGAEEPFGSEMSPPGKPMLVGTIACYRCHSLSNQRESTTYSAPFLRGLMNEDQMCFNCHRSRNQPSHLSGTHPVNLPYSSATSKSRVKSGEYYPRPVNANLANPTSQLTMKNGKIVCTTCHGVHYADSNSFTYDKYSSAVTRQFSTSKGYLLKTDLKRGSVLERNVCTNCHRSRDEKKQDGTFANISAQVKNHNGGEKQQNIQCADCHGGHVEFAGYSTAAGGVPQNEKTPNIFLINRFMNISSPTGTYKTVRNKKVIFNDINDKNYNKRNSDGTSYGVCMACHEKGLPTTVSQHTSQDWNICKTCHTHKQGFSADCTTCHGYPPAEGTPGGPIGYASTPFSYTDPGKGYKDESATPHMAHAGGGAAYSYSCDQCHKGNQHADGNFQDVFRTTTGTIAGPDAHYDPETGTCSSVYCHSDGRSDYKDVRWENGKGTIIGTANECKACHNYPATSTGHTKHVAGGTSGKSYSCSTCHANTVNLAGDIIAKSKHVNGLKEVAYSNGVTDCNTCHNDGKGGFSVLKVEKRKSDVNWDYKPSDFAVPANGACGTCHANPMVNDGHPAHITAINGPQLVAPACNVCHIYTGEFGPTHVDKHIDWIPGSCNPCHPGAPQSQPTWTIPSSVNCNSCHSGLPLSVIFGITASDKTLAPTRGHGRSPLPNNACLDCHAQAAPHLNSDPSKHAFRLQTTLSSGTNPNKACSYCHSDSTKVTNAKFRNMSTHFTLKGGKADMTCWQCHELHGTNNNSMIKDRIVYFNNSSNITFLNRSTGMIDLNTNRGLCQICHTQTKYYRAGVPEPENAPHGAGRGCFTCHPHNTKGGAFAPFGSCDACHGYPPVPKSAIKGPAYPSGNPLYKQTFGTQGNYTSAKYEDYSGGGGAHLWHVATNKKATDGWGPCAVCHSGGNTASPGTHIARMQLKDNVNNVTISIDPRYRFADDSFARYSGASLVNPPNNKTGSCVNVMCHFQPTPRWSVDR